MAYSAGQWLHAQGTRRLVTQSGGLGSIGVLVAHADFSKMLEDYGVEMTLIFDGQHKVDGNPYEKLPDTVKAQIKADCKKTRGEFATAVSRGTGLSVADVLNTEAECYSGQQAVDIGLADAVVSSNSILSEFIEFVNKPQNAQTGNVMSTQPNETATTTKPAPNADTQKPDANADTQTSPATLERTRIKGIMSCEDAQGRTGLASKLAYDTSMSVDEAVAILQSSPKEPQADTAKPEENAGATVSDGFQKAMNTENHPDLSADSDQTDAELSTDEAQAAAMLASFKTATGV
jgi:ClpP class serine protease